MNNFAAPNSASSQGFRLILASTSRYRAELLGRLQLPFEQLAPDCDETPLPAETPEALVRRLSEIKAISVLDQLAEASSQTDESAAQIVVIGSDQVADCAGRVLGKPHTAERAHEQLSLMSGQDVVFRTGLCVATSQSSVKSATTVDVVNVTARFRELGSDEIERYVSREKPLDCAGSFRSEARGISLLSALDGNDPNALIGLPLIQLAARLRGLGLQVP